MTGPEDLVTQPVRQLKPLSAPAHARRTVFWTPVFAARDVTKDLGELPRHLAMLGHSVSIVAYGNDWNSKAGNLDDIPIISIGGTRPGLKRYLGLPLYRYIVSCSSNTDYLILYFAGFNNAVASLIYKLLNRKGVVAVKMDSDGRLYGNLKYRPPLFRRLFLRTIGELTFRILRLTADFITIESPEARERVLATHPWLERQLVTLPNGVDARRLQSMLQEVPREKKVLYTGRIEYAKGVDTLISCFARLKDRFPDWTLQLTGEVIPSYEAEVRRLIEAKQLTGRVVLTGHLSGEALARSYLSAAIFCFPSRPEAYSFIHLGTDGKPRPKPVLSRESFGIVLLEAAFYGCAIISADVGAARYVLDYGHAGMIFDSDNPEQLTDRLAALMGDPGLRDDLSTASARRCREIFCWEQVSRNMSRRLEEAALRKGQPL